MKKDDINNPLLDTSEIDELFKLSEEKSLLHFEKGAIIFQSGTDPAGVYYLNKGAVRISSVDREGKEQVPGITSAGHYLELGSLIRNKKHAGTATAVEDSAISFIPRKEFFKLTEKYPQISHQLLVKFCYQLDRAEDKLVSLSNKSIREKLAETLLLLGANAGTGDDTKSVRITAENLAALTGSDAGTIKEYLDEFKEKGIINIFADRITILKTDGLDDISKTKT